MAKKYKCKGPCGESYVLEDMVLVSSEKAKTPIRWCKSCREKAEKEMQERQSLYDTIKELYGITFPTGMMLKQIKEYKEQYGYTYSGIELALRFCVGKPGIVWKPTMGIGIVPHYYERARLDLEEKNRRVESFIDVSQQTVTIKISKLDNTTHYKNEKLIDLEALLND